MDFVRAQRPNLVGRQTDLQGNSLLLHAAAGQYGLDFVEGHRARHAALVAEEGPRERDLRLVAAAVMQCTGAALALRMGQRV